MTQDEMAGDEKLTFTLRGGRVVETGPVTMKHVRKAARHVGSSQTMEAGLDMTAGVLTALMEDAGLLPDTIRGADRGVKEDWVCDQISPDQIMAVCKQILPAFQALTGGAPAAGEAQAPSAI